MDSNSYTLIRSEFILIKYECHCQINSTYTDPEREYSPHFNYQAEERTCTFRYLGLFLESYLSKPQNLRSWNTHDIFQLAAPPPLLLSWKKSGGKNWWPKQFVLAFGFLSDLLQSAFPALLSKAWLIWPYPLKLSVYGRTTLCLHRPNS